jgi:hypothetical protein
MKKKTKEATCGKPGKYLHHAPPLYLLIRTKGE